MKKAYWMVLLVIISAVLLIGWVMYRDAIQRNRNEVASAPQSTAPAKPSLPEASRVSVNNTQPAVPKRMIARQGSDVDDTLMPVDDNGGSNLLQVLERSLMDRIIGEGVDYKERLNALRQLSRNLTAQDIEVLMTFLAEPIPEGSKADALEYNSIRNDIVDILLQQEQIPEGMGELLVNIYNNPEQDEIWRNYSVQFMSAYYDRISENSSVSSLNQDEELALVKQTLWSALKERDNSNAGTALLGLNDLTDKYSEFRKPEVQAAMVDLAQDQSASEANRITALRLCGQQGLDGVLEAARDLAQDGDTTVLRCAAIATLGDLGSEEDVTILERYADSPDPRIKRIAERSLGKITSK